MARQISKHVPTLHRRHCTGYYHGARFFNRTPQKQHREPATAGSIGIAYLTGIGPSAAVADGVAGSTSPVSTAVAAGSVTVNGLPATLAFLGLTPARQPGLAQANFVIPGSLLTGTIPSSLQWAACTLSANIFVATNCSVISTAADMGTINLVTNQIASQSTGVTEPMDGASRRVHFRQHGASDGRAHFTSAPLRRRESSGSLPLRQLQFHVPPPVTSNEPKGFHAGA